jgi:hypothetical protein
MIYCIGGAPLLSNFLGSLGRILQLFLLNSRYFGRLDRLAPLSIGSRSLGPQNQFTRLCPRFKLQKYVVGLTLVWLNLWGLNASWSCGQEANINQLSPSSIITNMELARDEITSGYNSVTATGKISGWVQTPGTVEPKNNLDAEFLILRDGPRFHLQLLHAPQADKSPPEPQRLEVAVFDGKSIYTFTSSGAGLERGGIFFEFSSTAVLRSTGYPFATLLNFWDDAINLKEVDQASLTLTDLGRTGLLLKEDRATYIRQIYLGKANPFDIQRVALRHPGASVAFREHWLTWQVADKRTFVQHYVVRHRYAIKEAPEGQVIARQYEIDVEKFSPNAQHGKTAFTLEGLGVPAGTVFVDYRRQVKGKRVTMIWNGKSLEETPHP